MRPAMRIETSTQFPRATNFYNFFFQIKNEKTKKKLCDRSYFDNNIKSV